LRDIIAHLDSKDFYRLRVGIGRPALGKSVADFVLTAPARNELELMVGAFDSSRRYLEQMVVGDIAAVMNKLNA